MNIQMIGTGSAFAKNHYNNNALFEINNRRVLLDCGVTMPWAFHSLGHKFEEIDAVLISHIHADHVGGLEELAFQMFFKHKRKPKLFIVEQLVHLLWEHTLRGGLSQGEMNTIDHYFEVHPLQANSETEIVPGFKVQPIQTLHIPDKLSYSFLINSHFFYTADMQFNGELLQQLVDAGVQNIFHDCQLELPANVHASLEDLLTLPQEIQEKVWLMHYGDTIDDFRGKTGLMRIVEQGEIYRF